MESESYVKINKVLKAAKTEKLQYDEIISLMLRLCEELNVQLTYPKEGRYVKWNKWARTVEENKKLEEENVALKVLLKDKLNAAN